MPDSNVDIVRRGFDSFQKLDLDGFTADWHPDVVWDVSGYKGWPGDRTEYEGTAEVLAEFAHYLGTARSFEVRGHDVIALDDHRVLGLHHERRVNEGDEAPVHLEIGTLYKLSPEGKVTHVDVFTGHDEARKAAGLA
jgi:ketosteroid isomerase-like protein